MEVHPDPASALSDATTQLPPARAAALVESLLAVHGALAAAAGGRGTGQPQREAV
jgi:3-deoxy-D-arabino-heptulosonate 7-phosphate (DAHP) synthase